MSTARFLEPGPARTLLERHAAALVPTFDQLTRSAWETALELDLLDVFGDITDEIAAQQGLGPLPRPSDFSRGSTSKGNTPADLREVVLRFARQMSLHVGSLHTRERDAFIEALGPRCAGMTQAIYVADMLPRAAFALELLSADATHSKASEAARDATGMPTGSAGLAHGFEDLIRLVPSLEAIDPVTTELVRLLGARFHNCRVCLSVRSHAALRAGADDALFAEVDRFSTSDLPASQKAALAFADALLAAPRTLTPAIARDLEAHWPIEACVELVLDITRNATNKVAVALAADTPRVETGYEIYDVKSDGEIEYGLGFVETPAA